MTADGNLMHVTIDDLDRSHHVREDLGDLEDLTASVRQHGVMTPVTITDTPDGWVLVAGHRRTEAALAAGLTEVPAIVLPGLTSSARLVAGLVENLLRRDLDPIDEAKGYRALEESGMTRTAIALAVNRSKGHVTKRMSLRGLPEVTEKVRKGKVPTWWRSCGPTPKADEETLKRAADIKKRAEEEKEERRKLEEFHEDPENTFRWPAAIRTTTSARLGWKLLCVTCEELIEAGMGASRFPDGWVGECCL